jgi:signal transduction histidine kinase
MPPTVAVLERELGELPETPENLRRRVDLMAELMLAERAIGEWKPMLERARRMESMARQAGYEIGRGKALCGLAFANYSRSDHKQALQQAQEAMDIFEREGECNWIPEVLIVMYLTEWSLGNYQTAVDLGLRAMKLYEEVGNIEGLAWSYTAAGGIAHDFGDLQLSLSYHLRSIEIFERLEKPIGKARALSGIALVYRAMGEGDTALEVLQEALELFRREENPSGETRALNDIGVIYQDRGDHEMALQYHLQALALRESLGNPQTIVTSLLNIGRAHLSAGRLDEAETALQRALAMAEPIEVKPKIYMAHYELFELYRQKAYYQQALEHHICFHKVREEVFSEEADTRMKNMELRFEIEQKRKEAEIFRLKNVELARLLEELQAAQAQVVQSAKMAALGDLVAGVAHEMNSPLGVLQSAAALSASLAERVRDSASLDENSAEVLLDNHRAIEGAVTRLERIVRSLKGFARLDEADYQPTDLRRGLEETLTLLEPKYRERIEIVREFGEIPILHCYASELNQVFRVILENAIEAIDGRGSIHVRTRTAGDNLEIEFSDSGRGIQPDMLGTLFHPRLKASGSRVRAKVGLFGAYHIVQKHDGEIRVKTEPGCGTTFTLVLPVRANARA